MPNNTTDITIPSLSAYMQQKKYEVKTEINCVALGTIISFNATNQTVKVQVNYLRVLYNGVAVGNDNNATDNNQNLPYPQLINCPLMVPQGGGAYLTFPVAPGDQCVILFNDRDIDTWWQTGSPNSPPNSNRVHDLSDALVFVGVNPSNSPITPYNTTGPQLSAKTPITLVVNNVTLGATLNLIMIQLIDLASATDNPSIAAALTALQTTLKGILA